MIFGLQLLKMIHCRDVFELFRQTFPTGQKLNYITKNGVKRMRQIMCDIERRI